MAAYDFPSSFLTDVLRLGAAGFVKAVNSMPEIASVDFHRYPTGYGDGTVENVRWEALCYYPPNDHWGAYIHHRDASGSEWYHKQLPWVTLGEALVFFDFDRLSAPRLETDSGSDLAGDVE